PTPGCSTWWTAPIWAPRPISTLRRTCTCCSRDLPRRRGRPRPRCSVWTPGAPLALRWNPFSRLESPHRGCCQLCGVGAGGVAGGLGGWGMAKSYRSVDRDQAFLLPPDMRDWLPAEHLVWVVLDVIEQVDTSGFHRGRGRRKTSGAVVGRRGYDPDMLLGLLVYAYCVGERSSRGIESRCVTDVAFRVACAQDVPDHSVISRFRARCCEQFSELFTQVLLVCAQAGMVDAGLIALEGTKVQANASVDANKTEDRLRVMAQEIVAEAQEVDAVEDRAEDDDEGGRRARDARARAALA